jgi:hypothetical protein
MKHHHDDAKTVCANIDVALCLRKQFRWQCRRGRVGTRRAAPEQETFNRTAIGGFTKGRNSKCE